MEKLTLKLPDELAMERTKLANERTFLAYFRTFIAFLSTGFAILNLEILSEITTLGYAFLIIAPILFIIGIVRFFYVRKRLGRFYKREIEKVE